MTFSWSVRQVFWDAVAAGEPTAVAAARVGVSVGTGKKWISEAGGVRPRNGKPPRVELSLTERVHLKQLHAQGLSQAEIGRQLGRHRSTICRELARNSNTRGYRPASAQLLAQHRSRRPKPAKLATNQALRREVISRLVSKHSPQQIAARLRQDFPDRHDMWVSHETIYQAIYLQARGGLRKEVAASLRAGRTMRKTQGRRPHGQGAIRGMINISDRPAEVTDRAVPGHWEGDLVMGTSKTGSCIGTLVERSTRFVMLLHLPNRHTSDVVAAAVTSKMGELPKMLRRSLTWDQGKEMARHTSITMALDLPVYFCDPHSPWQRGSNENTNGLLRQYFPKGTDLSVHSPDELDRVAAELNARPRQTLNWATPAEALNHVLSKPPNVAPTA